ncbi:hypothetical protein AB0M02_26140 [Actinoplanes sp. NPDC051861]|uniref:hypothetical protein n=1 Tax=Actinoplanes sp. NPDC051861 TaxID=3155170 RepID=UPI003420FAE4
MTVLRRVAVPLTALMAIGLTPTAAAADALATVYDQDSRALAQARFVAAGDSFTLVKLAGAGRRVFVEYRYVRKDGSLQTGTHWGPDAVGGTARFDHDFGEGRAVEFRVCVEAAGLCSGTDEGENWTKGHA